VAFISGSLRDFSAAVLRPTGRHSTLPSQFLPASTLAMHADSLEARRMN
jgi:hypothetical protein